MESVVSLTIRSQLKIEMWSIQTDSILYFKEFSMELVVLLIKSDIKQKNTFYRQNK